MRAWNWALGGVALGGALAACSSFTSYFRETIAGNFYEPTGTVFMFVDSLTPPPNVVPRDGVTVSGVPLKARAILTGLYAYFDATSDQAGRSGSELAELKHEIEVNDWINLEWADRDALQSSTTYTAVILRDSEENIFRTPDLTAAEATPGFAARVRFRRGALGRNARYDCGDTPAPLCQPYRPMGSRITVTVTSDTVRQDVGASTVLQVTLIVQQRDGDPTDAATGQLNGQMTAQVITERSAENNLDVLGVYDLFRLQP
jgi:hypothetical protein